LPRTAWLKIFKVAKCSKNFNKKRKCNFSYLETIDNCVSRRPQSERLIERATQLEKAHTFYVARRIFQKYVCAIKNKTNEWQKICRE